MGRPKGGTKTGGRAKGTPNHATAAREAEIAASGKTPLQFMLEKMRDENADEKVRIWGAERAAQYIHPRPAPAARPIEIDLPDTSTAEGIKAALSTITQATATGKISPSEAQSLSAVIEAQRKAIETDELLARIEKLEQLHAKGR